MVSIEVKTDIVVGHTSVVVVSLESAQDVMFPCTKPRHAIPSNGASFRLEMPPAEGISCAQTPVGMPACPKFDTSLLNYSRIATSRHGIRHSLLPKISLSHCAPLMLLSPPSMGIFRLRPLSADSAIEVAVELIMDAAKDTPWTAALWIDEELPFVADSATGDFEMAPICSESNQLA